MKYCTEYINEYTHFVVWAWSGIHHSNGQTIKIESGWHYKDDAKDQLDQINELFEDIGRDGVTVRVLSRRNTNSMLHSGGISVEGEGIVEKYTKDNGVFDDDNWESIPR